MMAAGRWTMLACLLATASFSLTSQAEENAVLMDHQHMSHHNMADMHQGHNKPTQADTSHQHSHTGHPPTNGSTDARDPNAYADGYEFDSTIVHSHKEEQYLAALLVDRLEGLGTGQQTQMTYDWQAWYGKTYDRAVIRAEGNIDDGHFTHARNELLWGHALTPYWDVQIGARYDGGQGPERGWFALGLQGLAPYWIYVEATAYIGEQGRAAFRFESEYDLLITQRLILQPRIEANFYTRDDLGHGISAGLSDFEAGIRLRYEIRREFAPYIGVEWETSAASINQPANGIDKTNWVARPGQGNKTGIVAVFADIRSRYIRLCH